MDKARVSVVDERTIQINYPPVFRESVNGSCEQFLERSFRVEEVMSIEIEEQRGFARVHLRRGLGSVGEVMRNFATMLVAPLWGEFSDPFENYFELTREGAWVSYARAPRPLSGIGRWVYQGLGYGFLSLSIIGVASPFVPTTPFVLLSSYFFVRSSPKLNRWLLQARLFGPILRDWYLHRAMRRSLRRKALIIMAVVLSSTIALAGPSSPTLPIMLLVSLFSFSFVMQIPVIEDARAQGLRSPASRLDQADAAPMLFAPSMVEDGCGDSELVILSRGS